MDIRQILFVLMLSALQITAFGQTTEERIGKIRKMYAEAQAFLKNTASLKCANGKSFIYESFDPNSEKIKFDQFASICGLPKGYQYYNGRFRGYDWMTNYEIYLLNGKVFFAYIEFRVESCTNETRLYYNELGSIIRYLEKTERCEEDDGSREIKDKNKIKSTEDDIVSTISKIQNMIKK